MKNVRTTHFSFVFSKFFNLWREQFLGGVEDTEPVQAKVTVEKTLKRAGATPLFRLSAAQKVRGSLPPCGTVNRAGCFFHGTGSSENIHISKGGTECRSLRKHQGS
jgi:hypothetical protein